MATPDRTGVGRHDTHIFCYYFSSYSPLFFFSPFTISFVANYSNRQGGAKWDGKNGTTRTATAMRDGTGGR